MILRTSYSVYGLCISYCCCRNVLSFSTISELIFHNLCYYSLVLCVAYLCASAFSFLPICHCNFSRSVIDSYLFIYETSCSTSFTVSFLSVLLTQIPYWIISSLTLFLYLLQFFSLYLLSLFSFVCFVISSWITKRLQKSVLAFLICNNNYIMINKIPGIALNT